MAQYVSRDLTHFVGRGLPRNEQYRCLVEILSTGWLTHPPHTQQPSGGDLRLRRGGRVSQNTLYCPEIICFCDIPVGSQRIHMNKYSEFGISFPKPFLIQKGASPVFYVAASSMVHDLLGTLVTRSKYFDQMVAAWEELAATTDCLASGGTVPPQLAAYVNRLVGVQHLLDFNVLGFLKFFDPSKPDDNAENFYMEREWRLLGNLQFSLSDLSRVTLPDSYEEDLRRQVPQYDGQVTRAESIE